MYVWPAPPIFKKSCNVDPRWPNQKTRGCVFFGVYPLFWRATERPKKKVRGSFFAAKCFFGVVALSLAWETVFFGNVETVFVFGVETALAGLSRLLLFETVFFFGVQAVLCLCVFLCVMCGFVLCVVSCCVSCVFFLCVV